jgi:acyl-CoA synthetase (AMP-forming)/AMP-acid ligase II
VIITGGENVSSIEVEDALFSHPAVAEVAVIGVPDEQVGRDWCSAWWCWRRARRSPRTS